MKEFMNHLLYGMKTKQILLLFVLAFLLSSCIPPYCVSQRCIAIENKTSDTLLIGYSKGDSSHVVDSVKYFVSNTNPVPMDSSSPQDSSAIANRFSEIKSRDDKVIGDNILIAPDSLALYSAPAYFIIKDGKRAYCFIVKIDDARRYSWGEICDRHLYDTLIVTKEMLENLDEDGCIKYYGDSL